MSSKPLVTPASPDSRGAPNLSKNLNSHKVATDPAASGPGAERHQKETTDRTDDSPVSTPPLARASERATGARGGLGLVQLARHLPTALVFAALVGIGYWGHQHDWKIPRFSDLSGQTPPAEAGWCDEHGVSEPICIACNAALMPKGKLLGWCSEHGVAECVLDHPELAQLKSSDIASADLTRAARALALRPRPKNNPTCKLHLRRIQFADLAAVEKAGIDIRLVERGPIVETVVASGEITYDPTRMGRLGSRAPGTVWRVDKNIGDRVRAGEVLALVDSADVGRAKADLLQAAAALELAKRSSERAASLDGVLPGRRLQEAEAERAKAEADLRKALQMLVNLGLPVSWDELRTKSGDELARATQFLGLPPSVAATLELQQTTGNLIPVVAPRDGLVVSRDVVAGEVVDPSRTLFTVVDVARMWLLLDVPIEDASSVRLGQKVLFRPDGYPDSHTGSITWKSTAVDRDTRTVKVRAELPNDDEHLLNETFGAGQIVLREEPDAIVVPKEAVHWEGCCYVAFVRDKDFLKKDAYKVFHTRMVRPGVTNGDTTEMIAGLLPGEVVVTKGSGVLRAELLKGNLGAG